MQALGGDPIPPRRPRRMRRRRRSLRKRLLDGMVPFLVVFGLTVMAAGLVQIVEVGAAKNSKRLSAYKVEPHRSAQGQQAQNFDYENAQRAYYDIMAQHRQIQRTPRPMNQVAYQLSLEAEAIREINGLPGGQAAQPAASDDVLDWSLFEQGATDPRSALKRGTSSFDGQPIER